MNKNEPSTATKHIAFGADAKFSEQVQTVIKSICFHNRNVHFYLLNNDFPAEWFQAINQRLATFNSLITDIKINAPLLSNYKTLKHINSESTFFRYFIPAIIEADRVLYLDCDLVVNGDLQPLFDLDMQGKPIAAVLDIIDHIQQCKAPEPDASFFNAGVMLLDNEACRNEQFTQLALKLSNQYIHKIRDSDQGILNLMFLGRWLKLHRFYNYQVGVDWMFDEWNMSEHLENLDNITPLIVHYNTEAKPWLNGFRTRFRDLYWTYRNADWAEIEARHRP
ncbi:MAG: glycosyltransferase family 8 protein [Neisseria sp.]|nr:glycosyltransferase family 8 protein [Neisseria sp.]